MKRSAPMQYFNFFLELCNVIRRTKLELMELVKITLQYWNELKQPNLKPPPGILLSHTPSLYAAADTCRFYAPVSCVFTPPLCCHRRLKADNAVASTYWYQEPWWTSPCLKENLLTFVQNIINWTKTAAATNSSDFKEICTRWVYQNNLMPSLEMTWGGGCNHDFSVPSHCPRLQALDPSFKTSW